jgi:Xaa-Pro aminopeptidase
VKNSPDRALAVSGIKQSIGRVWKVLFEHDTLWNYINTNEHYRASVETRNTPRFVKWWKDKYPRILSQKNPILQRIRSIKESEEIDLIQSCDITERI